MTSEECDAGAPDSRLVFSKTIAQPADGFDEVAFPAQLAAERFHMHVDGTLQDDRFVSHSGVHELGARERSPGLAEETFQKAKFRRRQLDWLSVNGNLVAHSIQAHSQMVDYIRGFFLALEATLDGLNPLEKNLNAKRLGDIIVGSKREADELVGFLSLGRQHENWNFTGLFPRA